LLYVCPVCNGLQSVHAVCPACQLQLDDMGKLSDYYGPYSPYRPIDDLKLTNGMFDYAGRRCIHLAICPACRQETFIAVKEQIF